jgi:hypothetical protein
MSVAVTAISFPTTGQFCSLVRIAERRRFADLVDRLTQQRCFTMRESLPLPSPATGAYWQLAAQTEQPLRTSRGAYPS